ncbi:MAG: hypothetical protein II589_03550 [Clostridia bacterium]|nr:hypothetical protein [Clostridia bacterium]
MMKKKTTFGFALTCVLIAAALAFTGGFLIARNKVNAVTKPTQTSGSGYEIVDEVEKVIKDNYLGSVNQDDLIKGMCKGYVEGLGDAAVKYVTAQEYATYNKSVAGETILYKNFGKGIGYIQFISFTQSTKQSFSNALNDFSKSTVSKVNMLVLDLRNCSTGEIDVAASLLDMMLPEGEIISGVDKNGNRTVLYTSDQSEIDYDIAVLVNGKTSGVAEIFASTLSAYGKAVIVGTTTAGDCAQTEAIQLTNGDYVLIPNLYYVTKGQQTYSSAGVVPSTVVELSIADQKSYDTGTLDMSKDMQFLAAVKALGVNDVVMVSDSDTDKASSDSDTETDTEKSSDSDDGTSKTTSTNSDEDSSDSEKSGNIDDYWYDDEYWNNQNNNGNSGNNEDDEDNGNDYYDYDEDWD